MISGVDFNNAGGPLTFNHPNGLASDGARLLVCDRFNNRVLVWHSAPADWYTPPDLVLGQSDFTANNPGAGKHQMNWPGNVSLAVNGALAIADTDNDRILLWNAFPNANGQAADISLHLPGFTPPGGPMFWGWPWGVWTDGSRLAAVATSGHTLLFWNNWPAADNQPPDYTIDLPEFGTPRNISTDGATYFFVGDHNAEVTGLPGTFFWNSYPTTTDQPYDFYRDEWIKGAPLPGGGLIAAGLRHIYTWNTLPTDAGQAPDEVVAPVYYKNGDGVDVVLANGRIYVNNYNGNDLLVYDAPPTIADADPDFALGVSHFTRNTLDSIGYIQNPALSTDGVRLLATSDYDRKIYVYESMPGVSGVLPDQAIALSNLGIAPWDNAWHDNNFVIAGGNRVAVWRDNSPLNAPPTQVFTGHIGSAAFNDLKGVALDDQFFYLADRNGKVYLWSELPANDGVEPLYTLDLGNVQLNRISSDGEYCCVAQPTPARVYIFRVADLAAGDLAPWKTIAGPGLLNLPAEALAFEGALAIANQGNHNVLLWQNIEDAGNLNTVVVLGQPDLYTQRAAIGQNSLFMPGALLAENGHLWVGEFKFSSRILRFSPAGATPSGEAWAGGNMTVFPNPASTSLFIDFGQEQSGRLCILNLLGQTLLETRVAGQMISLDLRALGTGLYFVQFKDSIRPFFKG